LLSGGLDEYSIEKLVRAGVPVDAFGVGTSLDVSDDAPTLDMAYKLQEYAGRPRRKRSPGKVSLPGAKQVFREHNAGGESAADQITLEGEQAGGRPLLTEVMRAGRRIAGSPDLSRIREYCSRELRALPAVLKDLHAAHEPVPFPVEVSRTLSELVARMDAAGD
jgi:nicotinate phosphoribosyltransferase